ncbi:hypothetical protein SAMN02799636_05198 [Methylobacterium sp. 275MFSha3.1]|jgi:hypothetical protein|uniref:DUF6455 family protein n=1 Tax=Methylobacterium sp. 275MFSha3.1 TaxID=1502746 RepID=UPI0008A7DBFE|nr:DUF6455 family protein [Methylobacterium sp. 275MFSha3.1]SEI05524.1 hypothetical protein SAMN02799636_05198 [Methylobacterium sp. 275MFSha3.1]
MAARTDKTDPFDPFGVAASMNEWCCLLKAARELRDIDQEMMEAMTEADASSSIGLSPEAAAKVRNIANLMRSLNIDPEAVRLHQPGAMRELEAACLKCTERSRCARELWAGTASDAYPEYCPNAVRLDRLRHA